MNEQSLPKFMKAHAIMAHGLPTEVFQWHELPLPSIGEYDVLIHVLASSINPLDGRLRKQSVAARPFPLVLGFDACGTVVQKGKAVTGFSEGDIVFGSPNVYKQGANAEYVSIDARTCALAPAGKPEMAAAVPLAGITAYEGLYERLRIQSGDMVLIHGGAGGVGHLAVQLAKRMGCTVITTAGRPESIGFCKTVLKADHVIDYSRNKVSDDVKEYTGGSGVSLIFDTVGGKTFEDSLGYLQPNGHICTILPVGIPEQMGYHNLTRNITISYEFMGIPTAYGLNPEKQGKILSQMSKWIGQGQLIPYVSKIFSLNNLDLAHQQMESGNTMGKIVILHDVNNES